MVYHTPLRIVRRIVDNSCSTGEEKYITEDGTIWGKISFGYYPSHSTTGTGERFGRKTNGSIQEISI